MGANISTVNDRLLYLKYSSPETVKQIISSWSLMDSLAQRGDTVAIAIKIDIERALGISLSELLAHKKRGLIIAKDNGLLTESQFVAVVYCLGLGYSHREVAFILGCKRQVVDKQVNSGVKRICRYLEGEYEKNKEKG